MLKTFYFKIYIKALLVFKPSMLFDKINRLDWYKETLKLWIQKSYLSNQSVNVGVLEIGCSTGMMTNHLQSIGYNPTGTDLSLESIKQANKNYPNSTFQQQDVTKMSFGNNSFDNVIAASVINIVPNKPKALSEMIRVCKISGKISILVPNKDFNQQQFKTLVDSLKISGFSLAAINAWYKLAPKMKEEDVKQLFKDAGIFDLKTNYFLNGMVVSFVGIKRKP